MYAAMIAQQPLVTCTHINAHTGRKVQRHIYPFLCAAAAAVAIFSIFRKKKYFSVEFIHTFGSWKRRHSDREKEI